MLFQNLCDFLFQNTKGDVHSAHFHAIKIHSDEGMSSF